MSLEYWSISPSVQTVISVLLLLAIIHLCKLPLVWRSKGTIARVIGNEGDLNFYQIALDAYKTMPDKPYLLPGKPDQMILPTHFIDEIKSLPESKASFAKEIFTRFLGQYTTIGTHDQILVNSVKMDLTRNITKSLQGLQEETAFAFPETFGPCEHWTPIPLYAMLLRVVALLSGRVFVGLPLSRNEEWIHATINYTVDTFAAREKIVKYPWLLQPIMAPFIPEIQAIKGHLATAGRLLKPILKERLKAMQMPDHQPPEDMIQFIKKNSGTRTGDIDYQASMQMLLSLAAIHTTSMNLTHVIYDLCARPEYLGPLREELGSVLKDAGSLGKSSMPKLRKMDSFLKESQRMNPPSCVSMERIATSKLLLSNGLNIPKGTSLAFCSNGPNMDPSIVDKPEDFNGFRWSQLREKPGNETKYQFVTTGTHSINFGHGTHACPGRFFASNEIKVALAYVIQNYDFEFRNGDSRPANIYRGTSVMPDPTRVVMFRKVRIH